MSTQGVVTRQLTSSIADDTTPAWSPDSERIAFASNRIGPTRGDQISDSYDIYVATISSGALIQVTATTASEQYPAWRSQR